MLPGSGGCSRCEASGDTWVGLWICLTCGEVSCSDDSKNAHARKHYEETDHPIAASMEPGESWRWCYIDDQHV